MFKEVDGFDFGNGSRDNILIQGDCLEIMKRLYEEKGSFIDLIYIDPPFCCSTDKKFGCKYKDTYAFLINEYLPWITERIQWMHKLLKDTGSIFVHLDWHAVHYVKTEMDKLMGYEKFINDIVWAYRSGGASKKKSLARKHDQILWYSKNSSFEIKTIHERQYLDKAFMDSKIDSKGRFYVDTIARDVFEGSLNKVDNGNVVEYSMRPVLNLSKERTGYPTQKPEGLLAVLMQASTLPGAIIADFFSGSGTTISVAQKLGRRWIGVDQNPQSIEVAADRIRNISNQKYTKIGIAIPDFEKATETGFTQYIF